MNERDTVGGSAMECKDAQELRIARPGQFE